jgi:hypothetical protein
LLTFGHSLGYGNYQIFKMPGAADNDAGMKKRQYGKDKTSSSFNASGGGYSTDESDMGGDAKNRNNRRRGRRPGEKGTGGDTGKASIIWMVLIIGLMFCLMDVAYISRVLNRPVEVDTKAMLQNQRQTLTKNIVDLVNSNSKNSVSNKMNANKLMADMQRLVPTNKPAGGNKGPVQRELDRKKRREEEKRIAEEKRIRNIKMAALEALKAANGGKIPDDMKDKALEGDEAFKPRPMSYYHELAVKDDKDRILQLFTEAGLKEMDDSTYAALPTWNDVTSLYGDKPRIIGLDQCEAFQKKGNPSDHFVSTAGTFNSGTNLMAEMLIHNCHMQARMDKLGKKNRGIRWQV